MFLFSLINHFFVPLCVRLVHCASVYLTVRLLHYEPGQGAEGVTRYYDISGVADTGSACRLTVNAVGGGAVLTTSSYLTWPESANDDAWQAQWMHDGDGSRWV